MKKYLATLIALVLTSSAFAECALYVGDYEVKQDKLGTEIVVPVTLASSTPDSRGGTIIEDGDENVHFTRLGHVKVQDEESTDPEDPHMTGKWIVLRTAEGDECWYELNDCEDYSESDDSTCHFIMLSLRPDKWGEGNVPFYFMVDGTRYGSETDMQLPTIGEAEQTILNPLFESENMFCVPALCETNSHIYYTYVFGLMVTNDGIYLLVSRGYIWGGATGDPNIHLHTEGDTCVVEITPSEPGSTIYYRVFYPDETWSEWAEYTEALRFIDDGKYHIESYAHYYNKFPSDVIGLDFVISKSMSVEETMRDKEVAGVRYYNMLGEEMQEANGMTIVVTTYTDGTTITTKVMK